MTIMQQIPPDANATPPRRTPSVEDHPTARAVRGRAPLAAPRPLTLADVRNIALAAGADDAAPVSLDHPDLAGEREHILAALPGTRTLVAIVVKMHPDDVRSPRRSVANLEFHRASGQVDTVAHRVAVALSGHGHRAINPAMAFPMEMDAFPARTWIVAHKTVAVAAQLGRIGLHRSVIHPRFGSFILLGTVLTTAEVAGVSEPLTFNPCLTCKLCVAACPVGAIEPDGTFRFSACYDHNYREFMSGFGDYIEEVADSRDRYELRDRVSQSETVSLWQSLAFKPNYKAAHCIAVCPAGEDQLAPFLDNRPAYQKTVVAPLTDRAEPVFVVAGSDAEAHVRRRFPQKPVRQIRSSLRPANAQAFFRSLPLVFQREPARGWAARFHFDLTGTHPVRATVVIDDGTLQVQPGLVGEPDVRVAADGQVWLDVVDKRRNPVVAVLTRRLKVGGDRSHLARFAACFPR